GLIFVEALRLEQLAVEHKLMAAFHVDGFDVSLSIGSGIDGGFAVEDTDGGVAGIEGIEPLLEELSLAISQIDENGILRIDLIDFDVSASLLEFGLGVGAVGR